MRGCRLKPLPLRQRRFRLPRNNTTVILFFQTPARQVCFLMPSFTYSFSCPFHILLPLYHLSFPDSSFRFKAHYIRSPWCPTACYSTAIQPEIPRGDKGGKVPPPSYIMLYPGRPGRNPGGTRVGSVPDDGILHASLPAQKDKKSTCQTLTGRL